jgi:hypothetical protein
MSVVTIGRSLRLSATTPPAAIPPAASRPAAGARAAERFPVNGGTSCAFAHPVVEAAGTVRVRDVSMDGVGLLLDRRVEVGSLLVVGLANPAKGLAKTVLVRVAHVTPSGGAYLVGGSFLTPLTYQEMTTLVM